MYSWIEIEEKFVYKKGRKRNGKKLRLEKTKIKTKQTKNNIHYIQYIQYTVHSVYDYSIHLIK